ncbi:uncharacterized protein TNCV_2866471 [Trichonephila clavipes]|nr:uncharacterized protein TNCV_2866471 [Trichonephila clavipes]
MVTRGCVNSPNCFCYICGSYTVKKQQRNISNFVQKVYFAYFGIKLGDQDKSYVPHVVCSVCVEELRQWFQDVFDQISHISNDSDDGYDPGTNDPELFSQSDLNDLVRDLGLSKNTAEVLGSRLKERHLLNSGVLFSWYRFREKEFVPFFTQEGDLVFCNNVPAMLEMFEIMYEPEKWRLLIDSSKRSLKAVLLHNGNRYASVPVGHSVHSKECYENLEFILNTLSYSDHKWTICGDLKVISMLLGQQSGYTMFPCFLCEWDSRDRKQHYLKQTWPIRKANYSWS